MTASGIGAPGGPSAACATKAHFGGGCSAGGCGSECGSESGEIKTGALASPDGLAFCRDRRGALRSFQSNENMVDDSVSIGTW